jgi:hypothetical protein
MTAAETTLPAAARSGANALGFGTLALATAMAVLAVVAPLDAGARVAETAAAGMAAIGGALLVARGTSAAPTAGGLMLLAALIYFAVTNEEFQQGGVPYSTAVAQFVTVPVGLVLGATAFALNGRSLAGRRTGRTGDFVADGVILVIGTILLGIALGQTGNERLMPPKWNWVSFLGLTVTGALVLIVLRAAVKSTFHGHRSLGLPRLLVGVLVTELLLVVGLAVMIYGALNNLVLGANGFRTGFNGNGDGLAVWIGAALFLVVVRGGFKLAWWKERGLGRATVRELLYVAGVFAFIVGERSVISGKPPGVSSGAALAAAVVILLGALFLLVPVRITAKQARPEAPAG